MNGTPVEDFLPFVSALTILSRRFTCLGPPDGDCMSFRAVSAFDIYDSDHDHFFGRFLIRFMIFAMLSSLYSEVSPGSAKVYVPKKVKRRGLKT